MSNFSHVDVMGDTALGNKIIAFIYDSKGKAISQYNKQNLESLFSYESDSSITEINNSKIDNATFYTIVTKLNIGNSTMNFTTFGSAFVYKNVVVVGTFENKQLDYNVTSTLIREMSK